VLSIGHLSGETRSGRYYVDRVAAGREDYYTGAGEADGEWGGAAARLLGLQGSVSGEQLATLLEGRAPGSEVKLRRAPGPEATTGFDLTFSAPKSVSVLFAVGDDAVAGAVRQGHDAAVRESLAYLEREACWVRRGQAGRVRIPGDGFVAAVFRHRTSRAGDPQLHTHAVVANSTRAQGRWLTLDSRALYREARTAGFLYQAALRAELTERLGVEWGPVSRGSAEVVGVPAAVLAEFSRRRREIVARMAERGESSPDAARVAALDTRRRKDYDVPVGRLREDWRARAAEHGLDREAIGRLLGAARPEVAVRELVVAAGEVGGPDGICRDDSTFDRRAAVRWWAQAHRHGARPAQIQQRADVWLASPDVVRLGDPAGERGGSGPGGPSYSTAELLEVERRLLDQAVGRRAEGVAVVSRDRVDRAVAARVTLAGEQTAMVRSLVGSGDGVEIVRAAAGTGKTFALDAARGAWEAEGLRVYGCALSARAATELQDQTGIDATTIARLQLDLERGYRLPEGGVLVVDEAGMVGTRQLALLSEHAAACRTKLVLIGDDHQLPELTAGGAFAGLANRLGANELREVRRQQHGWDRDALTALRQGDIDTWAAAYRQQERIVARPTAREVREALVGDWWQAAQHDGVDGALMLAHRRSDVRDLNDRARTLMHRAGRLGQDELQIEGRAFAVGDRVVTTHNDRQLGVTNGSRGTITALGPDEQTITLALDSGRPVVLGAGYLEEGHLDHGYAATAHRAQGATLDSVFVLGSEDLYREWGYTALTRHRNEARFYLVTPSSTHRTLTPEAIKDHLQSVLGASRAKHLALAQTDTQADDLAVTRQRVVDRQQALQANLEVARLDKTKAQTELKRLEERSLLMAEERAGLRSWQRQRQADFEQQAVAHQRAAQHWGAAADRATASYDTATEQLASFRDQNRGALARSQDTQAEAVEIGSPELAHRTRTALVDPPEWLTASLGPRPEQFDDRDAWTTAATKLLVDHDAGAPAHDRDVNQADFGDTPGRAPPIRADVGPDLGL